MVENKGNIALGIIVLILSILCSYLIHENQGVVDKCNEFIIENYVKNPLYEVDKYEFELSFNKSFERGQKEINDSMS